MVIDSLERRARKNSPMLKWNAPRSSQKRWFGAFGIELVEHALDVEAVVEHQRPDRRRDAEPAAGRVAQAERIDPRPDRVHRLPASTNSAVCTLLDERNAQLGARIDEHVAAADHDLVQA